MYSFFKMPQNFTHNTRFGNVNNCKIKKYKVKPVIAAAIAYVPATILSGITV